MDNRMQSIRSSITCLTPSDYIIICIIFYVLTCAVTSQCEDQCQSQADHEMSHADLNLAITPSYM